MVTRQRLTAEGEYCAVLAVSYHFTASPPITPSIPSLFPIHDQMLCFRAPYRPKAARLDSVQRGEIKGKKWEVLGSR